MEGVASPALSTLQRTSGPFVEPSKPVVRLPLGSYQSAANGTPVQSALTSETGTPVNVVQVSGYPLPQKPTFRENWTAQIPMHQPRPQKAVSVAGIESPASLTFHAPQQQEQQPFHQQVPPHMNAHIGAVDSSSVNSHSRQISIHSQPSGGTPLSNILESAIHAPPFQRAPYQQQAYPQQAIPVQPTFYYTSSNGVQPQFSADVSSTAMLAPVFVQAPQQEGYVMPPLPPNSQTQVTPVALPHSNMVAHETNGMVYYYDPSQLYQPMEGYVPTSYAITGVGGMITPSPDGYYYPQISAPGAIYYQPQ
jgi:hypothetical protein